VRDLDRLFHVCAAATGKVRSPAVERRVGRDNTDIVCYENIVFIVMCLFYILMSIHAVNVKLPIIANLLHGWSVFGDVMSFGHLVVLHQSIGDKYDLLMKEVQEELQTVSSMITVMSDGCKGLRNNKKTIALKWLPSHFRIFSDCCEIYFSLTMINDE